MNGNKSTKSSIFSDLDIIIEKGTHQISEATESLTLDETIEDRFMGIFISRITRIK